MQYWVTKLVPDMIILYNCFLIWGHPSIQLLHQVEMMYFQATDESDTQVYPQTYQAFADVLRSYRQDLLKQLTYLEKQIQLQGEHVFNFELCQNLFTLFPSHDINMVFY